MIKVRVHVREEDKYDRCGQWIGMGPAYIEGELINIFWHPIEGEKAAIITEYGEIETFELKHITITGE